jgi:(2Fe-2S) ferredoxin
MKKPEHHIFVCGSFRAGGDPQGGCHKKRSRELIQYLEQEIADRGMAGIVVSSTGCLKLCDRGPVFIVYPANWWYGNIDSEEAVDAVLDSIEADKPPAKYLIA